MNKNNEIPGENGQKTLTWLEISAVVLLLLLSLGGLIYAFIVPVQ